MTGFVDVCIFNVNVNKLILCEYVNINKLKRIQVISTEERCYNIIITHYNLSLCVYVYVYVGVCVL